MQVNYTYLKSLCAEFLVTLIWAFTVFGIVTDFIQSDSEIGSQIVAVGLGLGLSSTAFIYAFMNVTLAHFNPAITLATMLTGKLNFFKGKVLIKLLGIGYIISQLAGATAGLALVLLAFANVNADTLTALRKPNVSIVKAMVMEGMLTFILVYIAFAVAINTVDTPTLVEVKIVDDDGNGLGKDEESQVGDISRKLKEKDTVMVNTRLGSTTIGFAPIAIGFTLGFLSLIGQASSGAVYNPALAFASSMISANWTEIYIYFVGEILGAVFAGWLHWLFLGPNAPLWWIEWWKKRREEKWERRLAKREASSSATSSSTLVSGSKKPASASALTE